MMRLRTLASVSSILLALSASLPLLSRPAEPEPVLAPAAPTTRQGDASSPHRVRDEPEAAIDRELAKLEERARAAEAGPGAWIRLGNAFMQQSRENMDSRLYERAEAAYEKALALSPDDAEAMTGLAWVHNSKHEFDEGKRWAGKALALDPTLQHAHALLGDAAVELGDYDAAFEHYQEALDLRPDLSSYSRAAHLLWVTGDERRARWLMQKAIDAGGPHAENTAWCRAELARMLWHNGALLAAEQEAQKALKQSPTNPHVLATMGIIQTARNDYEAAMDSYRRAVAIVTSHDTLVALGDLYSLTGRQSEADQHYERVVALHTASLTHSHDGAVHVHASPHGNPQLARFYADHNRNLDEAVLEAETAYRTYKNVFVADTLAWCYHRRGLHDQARKTIAKALRWKTPDATILFHAGMIYEQAGDRAAARNYFYRALSLNPHFHPSFARLASSKLQELSGSASAPPTER